MIQSMTGFGKATKQLEDKKISIELKSLNSKNLDLNARMPNQYREKEILLRNLIAKSLVRGKVDFNLQVDITGVVSSTAINKEVVKTYVDQLSQIGKATEGELLNIAMRLPDTISSVKEEIEDEEFLLIEDLLKDALIDLNKHRSDEGNVLEQDFRLRIQNISRLLEKVIAIDPERVEGIKSRIQKNISDLREKVDENRFEQELIYYIEKLDITEEKVRLKNHLEYFIENLNSTDSNGKKLGFISQEIGREINTIGSKSNFAAMQQLVVQMKDELEKIKEQLLNVL